MADAGSTDDMRGTWATDAAGGIEDSEGASFPRAARNDEGNL